MSHLNRPTHDPHLGLTVGEEDLIYINAIIEDARVVLNQDPVGTTLSVSLNTESGSRMLVFSEREFSDFAKVATHTLFQDADLAPNGFVLSDIKRVPLRLVCRETRILGPGDRSVGSGLEVIGFRNIVGRAEAFFAGKEKLMHGLRKVPSTNPNIYVVNDHEVHALDLFWVRDITWGVDAISKPAKDAISKPEAPKSPQAMSKRERVSWAFGAEEGLKDQNDSPVIDPTVFNAFPKGLRVLYLGGGTLPDGTVLPEGLKELYLGGSTLPEGTVLPEGLRVLDLGGGTLPEGTKVPNGCWVEGRASDENHR